MKGVTTLLLRRKPPRRGIPCEVAESEITNLCASINRLTLALEKLADIQQRERNETLEKKYGITSTH